MPEPAPIILLTRPLRQSEEFATLLPTNLQVIISPVLDIQPIHFSVDVDRYDILIFASQNAVHAASRCLDLAGKRAVAVGGRTAAAARDVGMSAVSAGGNARDLVAAVVQEKAAGKALFVRGRYSRGDVTEKLISLGIDTDFVIAYEQIPVPLSSDAIDVLLGERRVVLPLFSPRSAAILSAETLRCAASAQLCLVAMSREILAAWSGPEPAETAIASERTAAAMMREILGRIGRRA